MDEQDKSQKTEEPTQKRLDDARQKGQLAKSQEVGNWFVVAAIGLLLAALAERMAAGVAGQLVRFLEQPHLIATDAGALLEGFREGSLALGFVLLLPIGLLAGAALASNLVQNAPVFAWDRLMPDPARISPMAGAKRLFGLQGLMELAKSILKIGLVGAVGLLLILPRLDGIQLTVGAEPVQLLQWARDDVLVLVIGTAAVLSFLALGDLFYQKWHFREEQRMSKQEVKDEMKQTDGDPMIKARIRQIRTERQRRRMMAAVPTADVVIANPTHFAVALKYDGASMAAPKVVAKGVDHLALRIREVAGEHGVPVVENPPLARGLYAAVELDREVPPQFYKAVAEVIGYVMRLRGRLSGGQRRRA